VSIINPTRETVGRGVYKKRKPKPRPARLPETKRGVGSKKVSRRYETGTAR